MKNKNVLQEFSHFQFIKAKTECMVLVENTSDICHYITGMGTNEISEQVGQRLQEQTDGWRNL